LDIENEVKIEASFRLCFDIVAITSREDASQGGWGGGVEVVCHSAYAMCIRSESLRKFLTGRVSLV
jgi:hypothetical protein